MSGFISRMRRRWHTLKPRNRNTVRELYETFMPGRSEEEAHYVIWNLTAYPCAPVSYLMRQFADIARSIRPWQPGHEERAKAYVKKRDDEMAEAMSQYREDEEESA